MKCITPGNIYIYTYMYYSECQIKLRNRKLQDWAGLYIYDLLVLDITPLYLDVVSFLAGLDIEHSLLHHYI